MRTIQKITIIFLTLLLVGILTINVHASEKITFSIDNLNDVEQGSNITLTLKGENFEDANPKPIEIKVDVFYDADVLEYISAEKGSVVGSTMALHENYTDEGRIRIGIVSFTSIDKSGDLYSIQFKVKDNLQVSNSDVRIEISEVSDSSGNEIDADVKNATMIAVFNADRFGLATLHQLRGRIGRNEYDSTCILIGPKNNERLKVLNESNDGFYITEKDFEMRKEGDLFGIKQSGEMFFKIADLKRDYKILMQTKIDSEEFLKENITNDFKNYPIYYKIVKEIEKLN